MTQVALAALDVDAVLALADAAEAADGVAPFSDQTRLSLVRPTHPVRHHVLTDARAAGGVGAAGAVVAYAQRDGGSAELVVHPDHRRRGHGAAMLAELLASEPGTRVWAHGPHPGAGPLAAHAGMDVVRELWLMSAPGPVDVVAPAPPAGVTLTTFDAARDSVGWVTLNGRAFAHHPEQGRITVADLRARTQEAWFDPHAFWLVREAADAGDGRLLASLWAKVTGDVGEVYAVGVDPDAQGRGLGGYLVAVAMAEFAARRLARVELYVEADNVAAVAAYRRAGLVRERADVQYAAQ